MDGDADFQERLSVGEALAPSLVGLGREEAVARARDHGFHPDAVPPGVEAVTADLQPNRIRLFLDEDDVVVRARAG